jgi:hypothetical protein
MIEFSLRLLSLGGGPIDVIGTPPTPRPNSEERPENTKPFDTFSNSNDMGICSILLMVI